MEVIVECGCGLDVHQAQIVACLLKGPADQKPVKQIRTFSTMTRDLEALRDWLKGEGCTQVAMESTGIYWVPVYTILEGHFEIVVGNAQRIRNVPGKKSDVKDGEWLAQLLRHGLIAKSFVPPKPIRELRELVRYRRQLIESRSSERNRLLKLLESANIKLASVASDVFGASGMAILRALAKGDHDNPARLAQLARGALRKKLEPLCLALEGRMEHSHRLMLEIQLARLDESDAHLARLWQWIGERLKPYRTQLGQLTEIYGIDQVVAAGLIAEFGVDMSVFKDVGHMAAWVGVCPGMNESAGKRLGGRTCKGNPYARSLLVQAATAAIRKKSSYLRDKFFRLKARRGYKRALFAIAHKLLIAVYYVLSTATPYRDLGEGYLDRLSRTRIKNHLLARLRRLGYKVTLEPIAA